MPQIDASRVHSSGARAFERAPAPAAFDMMTVLESPAFIALMLGAAFLSFVLLFLIFDTCAADLPLARCLAQADPGTYLI